MKPSYLRLPLAVFIAALLAVGCGGGGASSSYNNSGPSSPAPSPAPSWPDSEVTPTPTGAAYYFSDCQSGAHAGCVAGDNANAGTSPGAPKRNLAGFNVNALPRGSQVLFARGGAWTAFQVVVQNLNATPTEPIFFDSYAPSWGGSAAPWFKSNTITGAFEFGTWNNQDNDGGYVVRNLKLDGEGVGMWGLWLRDNMRNLIAENLEITGFEIGVHSQSGQPYGVTSFTLRNSIIHNNSEMGMLGSASDSVIENNTIASNNFSGSGFSHGIYLGSGSHESRNMIVRGNTFADNSVVGGVCTGGNFTVHGQWNGLLVERNTITQAASAGGCYGISINSAYSSPEWFRNLIVRGNTIVNLGNCSICLTSAPGAIVENNLIANTQTTYHAGVLIPDRDADVGDDLDTGAIVRNNTMYLAQPGAGAGVVTRAAAGSNLQVVSNLIYFGAGASATHTCFEHTAIADYDAFANNLCYHAGSNGRWSAGYATLANAQAAGFDIDGLSSDPQFAAPPAAGNNWDDALSATSPAVNAGHATSSSAQDRLGITRSVPDIGSRERQ